MTLEEEIAAIQLKYDFMRYVAAKIAGSGLPRITEENYGNFVVSRYTPESQRLIKNFIAYVVKVYNGTHQMKTTVQEVALTLEEWWNQDIIQYQRENMIHN